MSDLQKSCIEPALYILRQNIYRFPKVTSITSTFSGKVPRSLALQGPQWSDECEDLLHHLAALGKLVEGCYRRVRDDDSDSCLVMKDRGNIVHPFLCAAPITKIQRSDLQIV